MTEGKEAEKKRLMKRILLIINCIIQITGTCGGPLVIRLYFIHGGNRIWLSSFLQTTGFPILLIPLFICYIIRRRDTTTDHDDTSKTKLFTMKLPLFLVFSIVGVLQVRQKFTAYSVNAVIMLILGAVVLALNGSGDRPAGESTKQYVMGFVMTLMAAILFGLILPLVELAYKKTKQTITYPLVLEIQIVMSMAGAIFSMVGMIINNDFKVIPREAKHFELGETIYYVVLVASAIVWQLNGLGAMGVIFCASSLMSGIMIAMSMPLTEVLAVIFYKEKFQAVKGISLVLSLWGFVSYFYGEFKQSKQMKRDCIPESEQPQPQNHNNITNP